MNPFTRTSLNVFTPLGIDSRALARNIEKEVTEELGQLSISEEIRTYQAECPLADAHITDYCTKLIPVANLGEIVTALRFRDNRGERPFIEILYSSFNLEVDDTLPLIRRAIAGRYRTSLPESISFFVPGAMRRPGSRLVRPAKALYAANLNGEFPQLRCGELSIRKAADTGFYERYLAEYKAFNDLSAKNKLVSEPEDYGYLAGLVTAGTLFEITIGGVWAGVIAYDYLPVLSAPGLEIIEEFITGQFRGRGYGKYAQSMLIAQMQTDHRQDAQFMFGTIHSENAASIRTAEANGRMLLGAWYEMAFKQGLLN